MKSKFISGLFLIIAISFKANAQWEWMHPKLSNHLQSVFTIENIAFTTGRGGTILKSTDTGINWAALNSGTDKNLNSIYFTDLLQGFTVGENGIILKTTDGGNNWINSSSVTQNSLNSVFFINQQIGFCCGDNGTFLRTSDAGNSWESKGFPNNYAELKGMYFLNSHTGFITTVHGPNNSFFGSIFKTTDSGTTWTKVHEEHYRRFYSIQFTDENTGYVAASYGILKTTDSGANWNILNTGSISFLSLSFPSNNLGFATTTGNYIFKTTDAGSSWLQLQLNIFPDAIKSIKFKDSNIGIAVGNNGQIIRTSDSGGSWEKNNKGQHYYFNSIRCKDLNTCYAAGSNFVPTPNPEYGGIVIKTTNGGNDWTIVKSRDSDWWKSIFISENGNIFIASDYGNIIKTTNDGLNWVWLNTGTSEFLTSLYFPTDNVGYAAGLNGTIIKTTDAGNNWTQLNTGTNRGLQDIFFTDENTGYVISGHPATTVAGFIYKTTDAGINWFQLNNDTSKGLLSIYFPSQNIGYAAGQDCIILKTTDAGLTWSILTSLYSSYNYITSLYFLNNEVGFATTLSYGNIYKTTDGGNSWSLFSININTNLNSVHFADMDNGFVAGNSGIILRTTNGGITFIEEENNQPQPNSYLLSQNYPNPFNPITSIQYAISNRQLVFLKIYDLLGREVATLVDEYKEAGSHKVEFNSAGLSSGVYFYRIQFGDFIETKKMVLLR